MFSRLIFFLLYLSPLFLKGAVTDQTLQHSKAVAPSWVKLHDFPLEAVLVKPSQVSLQHLLIDIQRNWEEKTIYHHFAVKILNQSGTEKISQLKVDFDPSYAQVVMHTIRVFREGKCLD